MSDVSQAGAPAPANGKVPGNGIDMAAARQRRGRRFLVFGLLLAVILIGAGGYWLLTHNEETTDDAFVDADIVSIASRLDGPVVAVDFTDNQLVKEGQVLVEIDPADFQVALDQARANLENAEAQQHSAEADLALVRVTAAAAIAEAREAVAEAQHQVAVARQQSDASQADSVRAAADVKRYADLVKTEDASRQRYEQAVAEARGNEARWRASEQSITAAEAQAAQAQAKLDDANAAPQRIAIKEAEVATAKAAVDLAQAQVRQAEINFSRTKITAPVAGRVTKRNVEPGNVIQRGQMLTSLVADPPWVVANFKETQIERMRVGQPVRIAIDAFPGHPLHGHVESIQPGSGSRFTLLPPENATGNYVKVVQRVPVKIVFDDLDPITMHLIAPGMSVVPTVDVGSEPAAQPADKAK